MAVLMVERMEAREQEMRRERTKGEELAVSELGREKGENLKGGLPEPQDWETSIWRLRRKGYRKGELAIWSDRGVCGQGC